MVRAVQSTASGSNFLCIPQPFPFFLTLSEFFQIFSWRGPFSKVFIEFITIFFLCFMFWFFGHEACGILAPQPGIEPTSLH